MFKIMVKDADDNKTLCVTRNVPQAICAIKVHERAGYNIAVEIIGSLSEKNIYNMRKLGLEVK